MVIKLLTEHHLIFLSLKGGCIGTSEYTLVKMPNCWKSHATAHLVQTQVHTRFKIGSHEVHSLSTLINSRGTKVKKMLTLAGIQLHFVWLQR